MGELPRIHLCAFYSTLIFVVISSFIATTPIRGQSDVSDRYSTPAKLPAGMQENLTHYFNYKKSALDTAGYQQLHRRFSNEVDRKGNLDLDSLRTIGYQLLQLNLRSGYAEGYVETCLGFGWGYNARNNIDSSLHYFHLANSIAESVKDTALMAKASIGIAWSSIYTQSYNDANAYAIKAGNLADQTLDTALIMSIYSRISQITDYTGELLQAFHACSRMNSICEAISDTSCVVQGLYLLETIYSSMRLPTRQKRVMRKVLAYYPFLKDTHDLYIATRTASRCYLLHHQYDSTIYFARLGLPFAAHLNLLPQGLSHLARSFFEMNQLDSARHYYHQILQLRQEKGNYVDTDVWLDLGIIEMRSGNLKLALRHLKKAESEIHRPRPPIQRDIYKALYEYYDQVRDYTNAYHYLKKFQLLADSIQQYQNQVQAGLTYLELEAAERANEIQILSLDNQLKTAQHEKQKRENLFMLFGSLSLILIGGISFYRYKKWKDLKMNQRLLQERLRISQDLHDEVGSTLSGINMYLHLARQHVLAADTTEAIRSLDTIHKGAGNMMEKLSDIVWIIHPDNDTLFKLVDKLSAFGYQLARAQDQSMTVEMDPELHDLTLPVDVRRNIFLIFKEAINNACKYSDARQLRLDIGLRRPDLRFCLTDDGKGFDSDLIQPGNGLRNMNSRAEQIGASLNFDSAPGRGARITLHYKLPH